MLGGLEEGGEGHLARGVVGAVRLGVGGVPRGPTDLADQLPEVGTHNLALVVQLVARVDLGNLAILLTKPTTHSRISPGSSPAIGDFSGSLRFQFFHIEHFEQRI